MIFTFCSHLLFISFAYHLLSTVVQWERFLKVSADTACENSSSYSIDQH